MRRIHFYILMLLMPLLPVFGQDADELIEFENLDDLFATASDTVVIKTDTDHRQSFEEAKGIQFSGSFTVEGGAAIGWTDWPEFSDPGKNFDPNFGLKAGTKLAFTARPDPDFRVSGSFSTSIDPVNSNSFTWPQFAISELFCDYTLLDTLLWRIGKFGIGWGQGKLFNPGSLMSDNASGFAVRASLPSFLGGASAIVLANKKVETYADLSYAFSLEAVWLGVYSGLMGRYSQADGFSGLLSLKKTVLATDIFADTVFRYNADEWDAAILTGIFREWANLQLVTEYYLDGLGTDELTHRLGLAAKYRKVFGSGIDLGLDCRYNLSDSSAYIIPGMSWKPFKLVNMAVGLPFVLGNSDGEYVGKNNPDIIKRRIAVAAMLTLSASY